MLEFAWPWTFLLLPLPLLVYRYLKPVKMEKAAVVLPFYQQLNTAAGTEPFTGAQSRPGLLLLLTCIWLLLLTATARPQWVGDAVALPASGRDLLLAVDISNSMSQQDMVIDNQSSTRLLAVKKVLSEFIARREGDRLGLVLFGSNAYLQAPLTFDRRTIAQFLAEAQLGFAGPKTAIGDAIGLSVKRLRQLPADNGNSQVLVLLTDGANTAGEVEPLQAAELAREVGVKIYTVGIGADAITVRGLFGPRRINPSAQLDEDTLRAIADTTGGRYFRARETRELAAIYQALDTLEPVDHEQQWLRPVRSLFMWPLGMALLLSFIPCCNYLIGSVKARRETH